MRINRENGASGTREIRMKDQAFTYFVSPAGSDFNTGLRADADGTGSGPFATVERAREEVRRTRTAHPDAAVEVLLRGGRHVLDRPLVFTSQDSGTEAHPVVYRAYPGEAPRLSGGRRITGWEEGFVNGRKCWIADLDAASPGGWNFTQLFVNGTRRMRARLPKKGFYHFAGLPEDIEDYQGFCKGPDRALYEEGHVRDWKNLADVGVVVLQLWFETHYRIRSIDEAKREVRFTGPSIGSLKDEKGEMARYFLENILEALEEPGEWYFDKPQSRLYYLPFPDESLASAEVIAPVLETLVHFKGTRAHPVSHLRLENLSFGHAEWKPPASFVGSVQAAFDVPGAILLEHAAECVLYGCEVSHVSQYAIQVGTGSTRNKIVACALHDLGAGGVKLEHEWIERVSITNRETLRREDAVAPAETTVSDCTIHDGSLIYLSAIGIWVGNTGFNRILRNHIFNLNYTGISCGWSWGHGPTATVGNRVEDNHIHHINWNRLLSDNGGIYTLGNSPGCVLRGNHIHHVDCYGYGGWGIYHDEGTTGQFVENNVVHHTRGAGFFTHCGRDNIIRNNIFALAHESHVGPGSRKENHRPTIFERNIVYWREGSPGTGHHGMKNWDIRFYLLRDNVFWSCGAAMDFGEGTDLRHWQAKGQFLGTLEADPLFSDPDAGDFTLRDDSPAFEVGFKPIRNLAGPRYFSGSRPAAFEGWPEEPANPEPIALCTLSFQDAKTARLTIANPGRVPVSGKMRIQAGPKGSVSIPPRTVLAIQDLAPGGSRSLDIPFESDPEAKWFFLEGLPSGKGIFPTFLHKTLGDIVPIPEVRAIADPVQSAGVLSNIPWRLVTNSMGREVARIRFALSGDALLVQLRTVDREVRVVESRPYSGSCVELFMTSAQPDAENKVCQLFLIPSADRNAISFRRLQSGHAAVEDLPKGICTPWNEEGYEMSALVPLRTAGIPVDFAQFFLEVGFNADFGGNGGRGKMLLFGAPAPFSSTEGCARVRRMEVVAATDDP